MNYATRLIILLCATMPQFTRAQSVIASDGGYYIGSQGTFSWTIGEPISETYTSSSNYFTQGFQQNYEKILELQEVYSSDLLFSVYPNPCASYINLLFDNESEVIVTIRDQQGRQVEYSAIQFGSGLKEIQFDVSSLATGAYILEIAVINTDITINKRFIKINDE